MLAILIQSRNSVRAKGHILIMKTHSFNIRVNIEMESRTLKMETHQLFCSEMVPNIPVTSWMGKLLEKVLRFGQMVKCIQASFWREKCMVKEFLHIALQTTSRMTNNMKATFIWIQEKVRVFYPKEMETFMKVISRAIIPMDSKQSILLPGIYTRDKL